MKNLLTQKHIAERWQISERTLERWRIVGTGPQFFKLGGSVRYHPEDIAEFEGSNKRRSTSTQPGDNSNSVEPPANPSYVDWPAEPMTLEDALSHHSIGTA